jgi:hypothetical protein
MNQEPTTRRGGDSWYTPDSAVGCFTWLAVAIIIWVVIGIWWRPGWWPWWGAGNRGAERAAPTQPAPYGGGPAYNQPSPGYGAPNQQYPNRAYPAPNQGYPNQGYPNQANPPAQPAQP